MHSIGPLCGKGVRYKGAEGWTLDEGGGSDVASEFYEMSMSHVTVTKKWQRKE